MATFSGTIAPGGTETFQSPQWPAGFQSRTLSRWALGTVSGVSACPVGGVLTDNQPLPAFPADELVGRYSCSFLDDFYDRVYLVPQRLDFGAVTGDTSQPLRAWSAYLRPITLDQVVVVGDGEGLFLGGAAVPTEYLPLQSRFYDVTAFADGPATIDVEFVFDFGSDGSYNLPVEGSRALLWPFRPNWDTPYRVTYEYRTDVLESRSGKEQRRALRQTPRKRLEHKVTLSAAQLRRFKQLMAYWHNRVWVMPERTRFVDTTGPLLPGEATVTVGGVPSWAVSGAQVVLGYRDQLEMRIIDAVDAGALTFTGVTDTEWPAGTRVYYALTGNLAASLEAPRHTSNLADVAVIFNASPGTEPVVPVPPAEATFAGREVFLRRPNWLSSVRVQNQFPVEEIDFGFGRTARFSPVDFATVVRQAAYVGRSPEDAQALLDFFDRMLGQQGEFYMASGESDMSLAADLQPGTSIMRVRGRDVYTAFEGDTVHRAVSLTLRDGTVIRKQVTGMDPVSDVAGEDTLISVSPAWDQMLPASQVAVVSWLLVWRLASDGLTIEWLSGDTAQAQLSMKSLEDLPVEEP